jgi:hypothetical protein
VNTAQLDRPAPAAAPTAGAPARVLRRVRQLRETTPGRLQLILAALAILSLVAGATAGLAAHSAANGTRDLGARTQPLLVEAETIYTALADADATAAQAFLAGGLEPAPLTERYDADLRRATSALASAARRTPEGGGGAAAVAALTSGVSEYAGLVATARANNRQGLPVGAAYLSTASSLNRTELQPQARALFTAAQDDLDSGYGNARSTVWLSLLTLLLVGLLAGLVFAQRHLSRITRRTFNVPLVTATVLTAVLGLGVGGLFAAQRSHLQRADRDGSTPVARLAEVRTLTLQQRSDEALTLAARGSGSEYETDFRTVNDRLTGPAGLLARAAAELDGPTRAAVQAAAAHHKEYVTKHAKVREFDDGGRYDEAVALAVGPETTATFTALTDEVGRAMEAKKATFTNEITAAGRGLGVLRLLGPVLGIIICALAVAGIRARLEEYR